jgi:hypothetical protein
VTGKTLVTGSADNLSVRKEMRFVDQLTRMCMAAVATIALAGCGAGPFAVSQAFAAQPQVGSPALQALIFRAGPADARGSWMDAEAKQDDLLYATDYLDNQVEVLSYPKGKLVGTLSISTPEGECTDAKGNVWISSTHPSEYTSQFVEFAHGATQPAATITLQDEYLLDCSVDPTSGALAITSFCHIQGGFCQASDVFVFPDVKLHPKKYEARAVLDSRPYYCGYDSKGNLFLDAQNARGEFLLAEFRKGRKTAQSIQLNREVYYPGGVLWAGDYLAVGDQEAGGKYTSSVHQVAIDGAHGKVVSTTRLQGSGDAAQFWIQGSRVVVPNIGYGGPTDVRSYAYPVGGSPTILASQIQSPIGVVVSLAAK